ncbi:unnamed protein product [Arabidopsis arenosa]|uniref:Protein kinase domain-containing protein n=1 Tax=Arabidopsis arenosa TaxID=38785 RepID=A0A8S1ZSM2_ARAAE|nr:unnamed protein product [Arabidopsis arenosa]
MGCVSSKQTVSVTPAIDHSGVFKENENECSGSGRIVLEDPPRATLKKLVSWRSRSGKRRSQRSGSELGSESGRASDSLSFRLGNVSRYLEAEQVAAGWPAWLSNVAGEAIHGWVPLRSDAFEKLEKIGQGTYSSVFRAVETETGRIVALKKLLLGKPILRGRTEVEQLHKIFKLCGSPPEDYWKNALVSQYFTTKPFACDPSSLPIYPPSKEIDTKHRDEAARKKISGNGRRGIDARKPSRKAHSFNRLAPVEDARHQTETFQKRIGHLVHNSIESDARLCGKLQNPLGHKKDEASHVKHASQGDVPFSGPLQVSKSNSFAWAKREKDDVCVRVHNRSLSRGHIPNLSGHSPAFKINKNENEDKTDSRGQESYEMVKRSMLKQWRQLERPDSFGTSDEYHSQELSLGLYQRDEMAKKLGNNLGDGDKIEFSGPLLSQSYGVDELLERHERNIRKLIRKPWFQKDKKQGK